MNKFLNILYLRCIAKIRIVLLRIMGTNINATALGVLHLLLALTTNFVCLYKQHLNTIY